MSGDLRLKKFVVCWISGSFFFDNIQSYKNEVLQKSWHFTKILKKCYISRSVGLEPTLPEGIWFLVRRLNHSATTALCYFPFCVFQRKVCKSKFDTLQGHLLIGYTANIYSHFTVIGCVTFPTVIWQWLSQPMVVPMTLSDIKEYILRLITILDCNMYSQITVGKVTLPKAVLSTVKIFAV